MTRKSAIAVAAGVVLAILVAAVAISMNYGIGLQTPTSATSAVKAAVQPPAPAAKDLNPIVTTRHITIHRTKPGRVIPGGIVTVAQPAPVAPSRPAPVVASGGGGGSSEHEGGDDEGGGDD